MTEAARATTGATVVRGSMWELAARSLPQLYVFLSSVFVARYLGAAAMGRVALISTVQLVVTSLALLGSSTAVNRYVGELLGAGRPEEARWFVDRLWRRAAPAALAAFAVLAVASYFGRGPRSAWLLAGIAAAAGVVHTVPSSYLMGAQRWREARMVGLSTGLVSTVAKVVVVVRGGTIPELFAVDACIWTLNAAGTWLVASPLLRASKPRAPDRALLRRFDRFAAVAVIGAALTLVVNQRIEVLFLGHYSTETQIAHYSVPYSFVSAFLWIPSAVSLVFAPAVATLWGAGDLERIRSGFARVIRLSTLVCLMATGYAIAVGADLVRLVYGPQFAHLRTVVLVLAVSLPFVPMASLSIGTLRGVGRLWGLTITSAAAVVADLVVAWVLVPSLDAAGAAAANTAAQVVWGVPTLLYACRVLHVDIGFRRLTRTVVASAAATAAGLAASLSFGARGGFVLGSAVFVVTLAGAAVLLRILPRDDAVWLEAAAGGRVGRAVRVVSWLARRDLPRVRARAGDVA